MRLFTFVLLATLLSAVKAGECCEFFCNPCNTEGGGGYCSYSACVCNSGWTDQDCGVFYCDCNGNGFCNGPNSCQCSFGWEGANCDQWTCACNGNGVCNGPNSCNCNSGWEDANCDEFYCPEGCVNGACVGPSDCTCDPSWTGGDCSISDCPNGCTFGNCTGPEGCSCNDPGNPLAALWQGFECDSEIFFFPPLNVRNTMDFMNEFRKILGLGVVEERRRKNLTFLFLFFVFCFFVFCLSSVNSRCL